MKTCVKFTKFTHEAGPLTKRIRLKADGAVEKIVAAHFCHGRYETAAVSCAQELADYVAGMTTNEALSYSRCVSGESGAVVTSKSLRDNPGAVARTKDFFSFRNGEAGILCLDYDAPKGGGGLTRDELFGILESVAPGLTAAGNVWMPSAGSCIWHGGKELVGVSGQRILIMVRDAGDIPRAGAVLVERLWLAGHGYIALSTRGSQLERTVIDGSVWDAARLDFVSGSVVEAPLEQRRDAPIVTGDGLADTFALLPDLTAQESQRVGELIASAKQARDQEAKSRRAAWEASHVERLVTHLVGRGLERGVARAQAENTVAQIDRQTLLGDWLLTLADGAEVTVAEALRDKRKYDGVECRDPTEPDYQGGKLCAKLFLFGARPVLHSFAHGATTYRLCPQPAKFVLSSRNTENVARILESTGTLSDVFTTPAGGLCVIGANGVRPLSELGVMQELATHYAFFRKPPKGDDVPTDFPERAAKMLLGGDLSPFPLLRGVMTAPFMAMGGRIVCERGFDQKTGYFLNFDPEQFPSIPDKPTNSQIKDAYEKLWAPFVGFPFAEDTDRGAMLAALLTAVVRPGLDVSPGFFFEAPVQGSGKTMLAECLKFIATGELGVTPWVSGDEELRKLLVSWMRGGRACVAFDNVSGRFTSGVLSGAMTSGFLSGARVLGNSQEISGDVRLLWLATGNNSSMDRDFAERWVRIRLDAERERPSERVFTFSPRAEVQRHRPELVMAALTLLRGWYSQARPALATCGCRFDQWGATVRECVLWLAIQLALPHGDPAASLLDVSADTETGELSEFLQALNGLLQINVLRAEFTAGEIYALLTDDGSSGDGNLGIEWVAVVYGWLLAHTTRPRLTPQSIGRALSNIVGRRCGGLSLDRHREGTKREAGQWVLMTVTPAATEQ